MAQDPIEEDEDGLLYAVPRELELRAPLRRVGRLPATASEVSGWHPQVVPLHWLLDDLARGERRRELADHLDRAEPELCRALGYGLSLLATRGEDARAYLHALVFEGSSAQVRTILHPTAWATALEREAEAARCAELDARAERAAPRPIEDAARDALLERARDSADHRDESGRHAALDELTARARPVAVELAASLTDDPVLGHKARALVAFADREMLIEHLRGLGLSPDPRGHDLLQCLPHVSAWVVSKTSQHPVGHDRVLTGWARTIAPELGDVLFEEIPALHPDEEPTTDGRVHGAHRLRAFTSGGGLEVAVPANGSWIDPMGLVGLANTLLERGGSEQRVVVVEQRSAGAWVLAAPRAALRALGSLGMWQRPRP
jgi:hypothetical protein